MDSEARLMRALRAASPRRDPRFTLTVMRRAEADRFRAEAIRKMLHAGGLAAAAAALAVPAAGWVVANAEALQQGTLATFSILLFVRGIQILTRRAAAAG